MARIKPFSQIRSVYMRVDVCSHKEAGEAGVAASGVEIYPSVCVCIFRVCIYPDLRAFF